MILVPRSNPRILRQGDQRAIIHLKSDIEVSKYKLFFINHMPEGSTQTKCYLVQVDIDQ